MELALGDLTLDLSCFLHLTHLFAHTIHTSLWPISHKSLANFTQVLGRFHTGGFEPSISLIVAEKERGGKHGGGILDRVCLNPKP